MPVINIGFGELGYGEGPYGGSFLNLPVTSAGCNPLIQDSLGRFYQLGIDDSGTITSTAVTNLLISKFAGPILAGDGGNSWQLSATTVGGLVATKVSPPTIQRPLAYIPFISPSGFPFILTVANDGRLLTNASDTVLPDVIPYIPDVSMSKWADSIGVICFNCGNATVSVSADLSCWCCSCSSFVLPEDTNIVVILDE